MEEGQREGDTESETGSRLWAVSTEPDAGLELTDREIMTWAKVGRLTDWTTQAPLTVFILNEVSIVNVHAIGYAYSIQTADEAQCQVGPTHIENMGSISKEMKILRKK